ncbi:MAG TPA: DEAD/DEAH box helicase [candidate division Zixibacteria bacterium]|nr:DEAD/DEAH box helicase [candidate division Zixibacteria bacterium]
MEESFTQFNLHPSILRALDDIGYKKPTPVQQKAIPVALERQDLVATAQTGTGKTAAYVLPLLQLLKPEQKPPVEALILAPTRELALQIGHNLRDFAKYSKHRFQVVYGGSSVREGRENLLKGAQIIVATPGRLLDYMRQGVIKLNDVKYVVLDEADRMLDMGFIPDIRRIMRATPRSRRTLLFSATFPEPIEYLAKEFLHQPTRIAVGMVAAPAEGITQKIFPCESHKKMQALTYLLKTYHFESALIFTRTKRQADAMSRKLRDLKYSVAVIHGDRTQPQRLKALEGFKKGRFKILVATNVAARGLDISGISHVINVDVPDIPDDYIHRIGRTARYEATGEAFTLVTPEEYECLLAIEAVLGYPVAREEIEEFSTDIEVLYRQTGKQFAKKPPVFFGFGGAAAPKTEEAAPAEPTEPVVPESESAESESKTFGRGRSKARKRRL